MAGRSVLTTRRWARCLRRSPRCKFASSGFEHAGQQVLRIPKPSSRCSSPSRCSCSPSRRSRRPGVALRLPKRPLRRDLSSILSCGQTRPAMSSIYPVVAFTLPDGSRQTVQIAEGSRPPAYKQDESVTIAYDPEQPRQRAHQILLKHGKHVDIAVDHGHLGRGFPGRHAVRSPGSWGRFRDDACRDSSWLRRSPGPKRFSQKIGNSRPMLERPDLQDEQIAACLQDANMGCGSSRSPFFRSEPIGIRLSFASSQMMRRRTS